MQMIEKSEIGEIFWEIYKIKRTKIQLVIFPRLSKGENL